MALTRKLLAALGIEQDKIDEIITAHTETVEGLKTNIGKLKDELAEAKEAAGKAAEAQAEIKRLQKAAEDRDGADPWKLKYDALKEDFEGYKTEQTAKETRAKKSSAYRALLKEAGVLDKRMESVLRVSSPAIEALEFDDKGVPKNKDALMQSIRDEWSDFIGTTGTAGAQTNTPPGGTGGKAANPMAAQLYQQHYAALNGGAGKGQGEQK